MQDESCLADGLRDRLGVFISIYRENDLKGSVGNVLPILPLLKAFLENNQRCGFNDQRFTALKKDKLDSCSIENSVFATPKHIHDIINIHIGTYVIILKNGSRQAALLPQKLRKKGFDAKNELKFLNFETGHGPD
jgi:AMMECR1 domain-containing protein